MRSSIVRGLLCILVPWSHFGRRLLIPQNEYALQIWDISKMKVYGWEKIMYPIAAGTRNLRGAESPPCRTLFCRSFGPYFECVLIWGKRATKREKPYDMIIIASESTTQHPRHGAYLFSLNNFSTTTVSFFSILLYFEVENLFASTNASPRLFRYCCTTILQYYTNRHFFPTRSSETSHGRIWQCSRSAVVTQKGKLKPLVLSVALPTVDATPL